MSDPVSLCFHRLTAALASLRPFARAGSALVGSSGLEPPTSRLSGARSNQLSYEPICMVCSHSSFAALTVSGLVEMMGFEPMTPCLQGRCSPS